MAEDFDDYRTDTTYEINYTKEITPQLMKFALALQGIAMPKGENGEPFRYLELGFGFGTSINIHAAGYGGEFWGVDFMQEHVDFANAMGDAAGLGNNHFLRKSFEEADAMAQAGEFPKFDVIAFHGIWSWVNAENRRHLINIVDRCLKQGGAVYNSYNTLPGWSYFMPVRELMRLNTERLGEDRSIEERITETLAYTEALAEAGASFFKVNPAARVRLKGVIKQPLHYLAQEYFNRTWLPCYFADIAEIMNGIGCVFGASCNLLQMTGALVPPATRKIIATMANRQFRETLRDFAVNQSFRTDLFLRDPVRLNSREQKDAIDNAKLVRINTSLKVDYVVNTINGKLQLDKKVYGAFIGELEKDGAPKRVADIFANPQLSNLSEAIRHEIISVCIGQNWVWPAVDEVTPERAAACDGLNRFLCEQATKGQNMQVLASPVTATGVLTGNEEMRFLYYRPKDENPDIAEWVRQVVDSHVRLGRKLDFAKAVEKMIPVAEVFVKDRIPYFKALGITF